MSALDMLEAQRPLGGEREDRHLARMAASGSELAFEAIVIRYRVRLLGYARRMVGPAHAEDAVQQALTNAWSALRRGCDVREPRAWLFAIVHRSALELLRSVPQASGEPPPTLAGGRSPDERVELAARTRAVLAAIACLPEQEREALISTSVHGHSAREAARTLGVGEDAVRQLVFRARARLRSTSGLRAFPLPPLLGWLRMRTSGAVARLQRGYPGASAPAHSPGGLALVLALAAGAAAPLVVTYSGTPHVARAHPAPTTIAPSHAPTGAASLDARGSSESIRPRRPQRSAPARLTAPGRDAPAVPTAVPTQDAHRPGAPSAALSSEGERLPPGPLPPHGAETGVTPSSVGTSASSVLEAGGHAAADVAAGTAGSILPSAATKASEAAAQLPSTGAEIVGSALAAAPVGE